MKLTLTMSAILLVANLSFAGQDSDYQVVKERYSLETSKIPTYLEFSNEQRPHISDLKDLFKTYWKGVDGFGFTEIGREVDQIGYTHIRYEQTYNGDAVEFAEWIVHTKNDEIYSMNGKLIDQIPAGNKKSISKRTAFAAAKSFIGAEQYKWEIPEEEAHLRFETGNPFATYYPAPEMKYISKEIGINSGELRLSYKFNIYAQNPMSRREIYIDAADGQVVFENNLIHTANSQGTAVTAYSGTQTITTDSLSATSYRLRSTGRGNGVFTYNLLQGTNYANSVDFTDADNNWNNVNANRDQYATDAQWGSEGTYDYYFTKFGRNSIDNAGFPLVSYLHYSVNFNNAFWDGQRMTYGDGNGASTPLCALDVASHEVSHGLTTFTANLIYANESGALNESFSDIFGTAVEFFHRPSRANWTLGEDIGSAFRSLSNPGAFGDPDTYDGNSWVTTAQTGGCTPTQNNDQCGVHTNSGVQNFWFYLLSQGGSGTNDNGDPYSVTGISIDSAAAIAYRNLVVYLTQSSDYRDARFFSIQAAIDLFGACSPQHISVTNAWHAVGVGAAYTPGVNSDFFGDITSSCTPGLRTQFTNNSNNATVFTWNFGDGTFSTVREPLHIYSNYGQYDVSLIANGGACGIDTLVKSRYIEIDSTLACVVILDNGSTLRRTTCTGKIYDSGGPNGDYGANETGLITISPPNAASVTISFPFFDIEAGTAGTICDFDVLRVFDGTSVNAPLLGEFCNNNLPSSITSTRGDITIEFESDGGLEEAGFEIDWQCNLPTTPPITDFSVNETSTCIGEIVFTDNSTQIPSSWMWDFGDGTISTLQNPVHNYVLDGTYSVKLLSTNAFGADSTTKSNLITVARPSAPQVISDTVCSGQSGTLTASAPGAINWYSTEFGGTALATGNTYSTAGITTNTQFWAENLLAGASQNVGAPNNAIGTGANFNNFQYLIFDVLDKVELVSVLVYASGAGVRTVELRDASGTVLQSVSRSIPTGASRMSVNFTIDPGVDYQLGVPAGTQPNLYRNNSGVSYPYTIANKISITRSSAGTNATGFYYFFYDWEVKSPDCISARAPVSVVVDTSCGVTSIDEASALDASISLYPNPSNGNFTIDVNGKPVERIEVLDMGGKLVYSKVNQAALTILQIDGSNWESGVYFVKISTDLGIVHKKIILTNK